MARAINFKRIFFLFLTAALLSTLRQFLPGGLPWKGHWPDDDTSAEMAYKQMSQPGDPAFIALADVVALHSSKEAVFLDARKTEDFQKGRIPGARNLPFYELEKFAGTALAGVNAETPLIVYCEGVGCELSLFLGRELLSSGFTNVHVFYGGYPEWQKAGLDIEK